MTTKQKKKLTLLLFNATGTPVKQVALPKALFPTGAIFLLIITIGFCFGIMDYLRLHNENKTIELLRTSLKSQTEIFNHQRIQIAAFTQKIDRLNGQLAELQEFEQKIRIIANLSPREESSSMFGVGGPDTEEIDPSTVIKEDHKELIRDMHIEMNEIDHASHDQQIAFTALYDQLEGKRNLLAATPSIRPVKGWITSPFGRRKSPFTGRREFHRGLDIATRAGTPIIAPADGLVTYSGRKGLMGNMLTIEHGFGMVTRYGHTKKLLKKKGEHVKRGEAIALVGSTGRSTGPHLHYEVRLNGVAVNPKNYFFN